MPEVEALHVRRPGRGVRASSSKMFANSPDLRRQPSPSSRLPPSYRVVPDQAELVETDRRALRGPAPGVQRRRLRQGARSTALLEVTRHAPDRMLSASPSCCCWRPSLLILNTIRMAIFARRREVAVMKLVGATNWFIRVPFMLEGLVQGLVGRRRGLRHRVPGPQRRPRLWSTPSFVGIGESLFATPRRRHRHRHLPAGRRRPGRRRRLRRRRPPLPRRLVAAGDHTTRCHIGRLRRRDVPRPGRAEHVPMLRPGLNL